jgi:hypothetical protein
MAKRGKKDNSKLREMIKEYHSVLQNRVFISALLSFS